LRSIVWGRTRCQSACCQLPRDLALLIIVLWIVSEGQSEDVTASREIRYEARLVGICQERRAQLRGIISQITSNHKPRFYMGGPFATTSATWSTIKPSVTAP
jgi:hypothetical protein